MSEDEELLSDDDDIESEDENVDLAMTNDASDKDVESKPTDADGKCAAENSLTLPEVSTGYTLPPGLTYIFNFWHSATLALSTIEPECKNVG